MRFLFCPMILNLKAPYVPVPYSYGNSLYIAASVSGNLLLSRMLAISSKNS